MEVWKLINDYPNYSVSNLGRVKSNVTGRVLKSAVGSNGYCTVVLYNSSGGKSHTIHRLVAKYFLENYSNTLEVNHKDEDKTNNNVSNLEMCTRIYNRCYGTAIDRHKKKLSFPIVQMSTDGEIIRTFDSIKEASRTLGLKASSIAYCCKGGYYDKHRNSFHTVSTVGGYKFAYNE